MKAKQGIEFYKKTTYKGNYLCTPYFLGQARKCRQLIYLFPMVTGFRKPVLSFNGLICFYKENVTTCTPLKKQDFFEEKMQSWAEVCQRIIMQMSSDLIFALLLIPIPPHTHTHNYLSLLSYIVKLCSLLFHLGISGLRNDLKMTYT